MPRISHFAVALQDAIDRCGLRGLDTTTAASAVLKLAELGPDDLADVKKRLVLFTSDDEGHILAERVHTAAQQPDPNRPATLQQLVAPATPDHPTTSSDHPTNSSNHPTPSSDHPTNSINHPTPSSDHPTNSSNHPTPSSDHPTPSSDHPTTSSDHPTTSSDATNASPANINGTFDVEPGTNGANLDGTFDVEPGNAANLDGTFDVEPQLPRRPILKRPFFGPEEENPPPKVRRMTLVDFEQEEHTWNAPPTQDFDDNDPDLTVGQAVEGWLNRANGGGIPSDPDYDATQACLEGYYIVHRTFGKRLSPDKLNALRCPLCRHLLHPALNRRRHVAACRIRDAEDRRQEAHAHGPNNVPQNPRDAQLARAAAAQEDARRARPQIPRELRALIGDCAQIAQQHLQAGGPATRTRARAHQQQVQEPVQVQEEVDDADEAEELQQHIQQPAQIQEDVVNEEESEEDEEEF